MKLIFCDTSTEKLYLAIKNNSYSVQTIIDTGFTHTENLASIFDFNFKLSKIENIQNIDYIILGEGPGSFTGIRIAYSFFKGLAIKDKIPFIELPTLFLNFLSISLKNKNSLYIPLIYGKKNRYYGKIFPFYSDTENLINLVSEEGIFDLSLDEILKAILKYISALNVDKQNNLKNINFYLNKKYHKLIDKNYIDNFFKNNFNIQRVNKLNLKTDNVIKTNIFDFNISPEKILDFVDNNINNLNIKSIDKIEPFYARKPDAEIKKN